MNKANTTKDFMSVTHTHSNLHRTCAAVVYSNDVEKVFRLFREFNRINMQ